MASFGYGYAEKPILFPKNVQQTTWIHFSGILYIILFFCRRCASMCWSVHCSPLNKSSLKSKRLIIFGCFSRAFATFIRGRDHVESTIHFLKRAWTGIIRFFLAVNWVCDVCKWVLSSGNHQVNFVVFVMACDQHTKRKKKLICNLMPG